MKIIKVFVSSLFNEMTHERDMLHRQVSALINSKSENSQDFSVLFVDLRWGIDSRNKETNFEKSDYILEKCFEAIRECDLFLGIIGTNFGSIANSEAIKNYFDDEILSDESYTSLEIKYASRYLPPDRMLFMMTWPSERDEYLVKELKQNISSKYQTRFYKKEDHNGLISNEFISGISDILLTAINCLKRSTVKSPVQWFPRLHVLSLCREAIGKNNIVLLKGTPGCGKSVILRMLLEDYQQSENYNVLFSDRVFYEYRISITDDLKIWTEVNLPLEKMLKNLQSRIQSSQIPYIIFVDSIDEIDNSEFFALYSKITQLPSSKVTMFISSSSNFKIKYLDGLDILVIDADRLDSDEIVPFSQFIARQTNKLLFPEVCEAIQNNGDSVYNAFYLSVLVHQIIIMNADVYAEAHSKGTYLDSLIRKMVDIVINMPKTVEGIFFLKIQDIDSYTNKEFSVFLFELMCAFRLPLSIELAQDTFRYLTNKEWSDMDYYVYRYYLDGFLAEKDGILSFTHGIINQCAYSKFSNINESYYLDGIYHCLRRIGKEDVFIYFTAARIQRNRLLTDGLKIRGKKEYVLEAIANLFYLDASIDNLDESSNLWILYKTICEIDGTDIASDVLIYLIESSFFHADLATIFFYYRAFSVINCRDTSTQKLLKIIVLLAQFLVDKSMEQMGGKVISSFFEILEKSNFSQTFMSEEMFSAFEDAIYYISSLLMSLDHISSAKDLQMFSLEMMVQSPKIKVYYPRIIQNIQKNDVKLALHICTILSEKFHNVIDSDDMKIYGNLLYAQMTLYAQQGSTDLMENVLQEMCDIFVKQYESDNLDLQNLYNYGLALSARIMSKESRDNPLYESSLYRQLISLRKHMCKIRPDSYDNILCLSNTVINMINNKVNIGDSYDELLEYVYQLISTLARRGNPRACWIISALFLDRNVKSDFTYHFFTDKLLEIEMFLNPIMELNRGKRQLATEIIYTYLQIYHKYCKLEILPLKNGHHLLLQLYTFAKQEILDAEPNLNKADVELGVALIRIYAELVSIILSETYKNRDFLSILNNSEYSDFRTFSEDLYSKRKNPESELLLSIAESSDVLVLLLLYLDIHSMGQEAQFMFRMIEGYLNINIEITMLEHCAKAISYWKSITECGIKIPPDIFNHVNVCVEILSREGKSSVIREKASKYRSWIRKIFPNYIDNDSTPIWTFD